MMISEVLLRKRLAGAQVERHALPAPVVDVQLEGGVGGRLRAGCHPFQHRSSPSYCPRTRVAQVDRADAFEHLGLLVADCIGVERRGRFHGHQRQQLQQVVLEHIAHHARPCRSSRPGVPTSTVFGDGDLHVVDVAAVPDRLEDGVGEAEEQDILGSLLAQVMVDAVDLALVEDVVHRPVELLGRGQVAAEGLLDDDAPPAARLPRHACLAQPLHRWLIIFRRGGQVIQAVRRSVFKPRQEGIQPGVILQYIQVPLEVKQHPGKLFPDRLIESLCAEDFHPLFQLLAEGFIGEGAARKAHDVGAFV